MATYLQTTGDYSQQPSKNVADYLEILRRRTLSIFIVGGVVAAITILLAVSWPPTYHAAATILIEEQDIPSDFVRSTITSYADQRIQVITARVMTRANLLDIIKQYDLYKKDRLYKANEEIVERMREDTELEIISADVLDPVSRKPIVATIAFYLSYKGSDPATVLKVTNKLVSLYLDENLKTRAQKAAETSSFLSAEARELSIRISDLEEKVADFKEEQGDKLPEFTQLNFQLLERVEREMVDTENQIRALQDRKFYLDGQIAQINPDSPMYSASGERILSPEDQLKVLKTEILRMKNRYQANHPDIIGMAREIESLQKTTRGVAASAEILAERTRLRTELVTKADRYTKSHPEIIDLKESISNLDEALNKSRRNPRDDTISYIAPENPAFITLSAQLDSVNHDLEAYQTRLEKQQQKLDELEQRLIQSPRVEREYLTLNRDYENAVVKYREIKAKQLEAEIAEELELENKAERFSLIDPPALPEEPVSPNRVAIVLLGIIVSCSASIGFALIRDGLDASMYTLRDMRPLRSNSLLMEIPYSANSVDKAKRHNNRRILIISLAVLVVTALITLHFFVSPLDVLGYRIERVINRNLLF